MPKLSDEASAARLADESAFCSRSGDEAVKMLLTVCKARCVVQGVLQMRAGHQSGACQQSSAQGFCWFCYYCAKLSRFIQKPVMAR